MTYEKLLNKKDFVEVNDSLISYDYYLKERDNSYSDQVTLEGFCSDINSSDKKHILIDCLNKINESCLYHSYIHGINHNQRVSLYGFYIGINEGLSNRDIYLVLEGCKYHDIGRIDDYEDKLHGYRGACLIDDIEYDLSDEELKILKCMITYHSIDDRHFDKIAKLYGVIDTKRLYKLCSILKDADALDRTRVYFYGLDPKYLRTDTAKKMILLSYELLYNYEEIIKKRVR